MGAVALGWVKRKLIAFAKINRLPTTVSYNIAYFVLGAALASARIQPGRLGLVGYYVAGIYLVKMQASVADAIHDQHADATNPTKSSVAHSVVVLGRRVAWTVLVVELVVGICLFGYVSIRTGDIVFLLVGSVFAILGFMYSFPPRFKERGVLNHVVTTGTDVAFVVLAFTYLLADALTVRTMVVGSVLFLYSFAYHILHQAADVHFDLQAGIETFASRLGPDRSVALAGLLTAGAAGGALALGYPLAAVALLVVTGFYVSIYSDIRKESVERQTRILSDRFDITRVATALNLALAVSVLRHLWFHPDWFPV